MNQSYIFHFPRMSLNNGNPFPFNSPEPNASTVMLTIQMRTMSNNGRSRRHLGNIGIAAVSSEEGRRRLYLFPPFPSPCCQTEVWKEGVCPHFFCKTPRNMEAEPVPPGTISLCLFCQPSFFVSTCLFSNPALTQSWTPIRQQHRLGNSHFVAIAISEALCRLIWLQ